MNTVTIYTIPGSKTSDMQVGYAKKFGFTADIRPVTAGSAAEKFMIDNGFTFGPVTVMADGTTYQGVKPEPMFDIAYAAATPIN